MALTALYYALRTRIRQPYIKAWDEQRAAFRDDALRGSSALRAALLRRAADESAMALDIQSSATCLDMAKFYDTISVRKLKAAATEL